MARYKDISRVCAFITNCQIAMVLLFYVSGGIADNASGNSL